MYIKDHIYVIKQLLKYYNTKINMFAYRNTMKVIRLVWRFKYSIKNLFK